MSIKNEMVHTERDAEKKLKKNKRNAYFLFFLHFHADLLLYAFGISARYPNGK